MALHDDGQSPRPAGHITGTPKQAVSSKASAGCMKAFCRITAASAGSIPELSMADCKVAGRSQKQPTPSGREYTELCVFGCLRQSAPTHLGRLCRTPRHTQICRACGSGGRSNQPACKWILYSRRHALIGWYECGCLVWAHS